MHDLHFFLVILRSEKGKGGFLGFLKTWIPHLHSLHHTNEGAAEKEIYKQLKIKL